VKEEWVDGNKYEMKWREARGNLVARVFSRGTTAADPPTYPLSSTQPFPLTTDSCHSIGPNHIHTLVNQSRSSCR